MAYETILYDIDGDIATLTLNRPEVMNALTARCAWSSSMPSAARPRRRAASC